MTTTGHEPVVHLVRTIPAPPERVYRAWLDPALMRRWFAPADFTVTEVVVEERVGGRHSVRQRAAHGDVGGFESRLLELVPDRRIVFAWGFVGPDGIPEPGHESRLTVELRPVGDDQTELTLRHERLGGLQAAHPEIAAGVSEGWEQALSKLVAAVQA